uniref:Amino acid transporter transmembrane domain-containing protein n=1 Tax=Zooxanthella nutricula TaxID=1333877 RepID=A0A7S2PGK9_9DINO|eukprot:CAMPEP_0198595480 /NCGR_PEP_ID=MMETSP1462-20131121/141925_1 /TAXON_ID=1333877 /ORGANISM="Brandtodinium nutriculum, Strain RCC3387" /LENGTH=491 /DNA_ID=CAMNT_0044327117 /DNA_START=1 /DNA_END=1476 /DNA_ORIENTATION=-
MSQCARDVAPPFDHERDEYASQSSGSQSSDSIIERRGTSWVDVAWLMLSDVVGTSVLVFAGVARQLGVALTVVFIVGLFPPSLFVSVLMVRTRALTVKAAQLRGQRMPRLGAMGEVAGYLLRTPRGGSLVYTVVYGYTLLGQASYLLVLGTSLQDVARPGLCLYTALALACGVAVIPVAAIRNLGDSVVLCFANLLLIVAVVVIALAKIVGQADPSAPSAAHAFAPDLTLAAAFGAATNVVYSYSGQWMYFEIMDTMDAPWDFPKAFGVAGPIMVSIYLSVALVAYCFGAHHDDILKSVDEGPALRVASVLLFLHVIVVYLVKSIVIQRHLHHLTSPRDLDKRSLASYAKHGGWGAAMLVFCYVVANAVPFFSQLLGLIGGLCSGPINFLLPIFLFLVASGRCAVAKGEDTADSSDSGADACASRPVESSLSAARRGLSGVGAGDLAFMGAICVFIVLTMVLGVTSVVRQIIEEQGAQGRPFTCHARDHSG